MRIRDHVVEANELISLLLAVSIILLSGAGASAGETPKPIVLQKEFAGTNLVILETYYSPAILAENVTFGLDPNHRYILQVIDCGEVE